MSPALRAIIHAHIADRYTAVVLHFSDPAGRHHPVEITIDIDGSIAQISDRDSVSLRDDQRKICAWDQDLVTKYQLGAYRVDVHALIELEDQVF